MFKKPTPLSDAHDVSHFNSGEPSIDLWLQDLALYNQSHDYTRTWVICDPINCVVGYYALCTSSINRNEQPKAMKSHGQPRDIPVVLLARMGVDQRWQGRGLGGELLKHALMCAVDSAQFVAFRAVKVHALTENAEAFYKRYGFVDMPGAPKTLLLPMRTILASLPSK